MLTCTSCNETKDNIFFKKDSRKLNGYASICKECAAAQSRKYHHENIDKVRSRPIDREKKRQYDRESYARNKEKRIAYVAQWCKENPAKVNAIQSKRRAAKKKRTPKWLTEEHYSEILGKYAIAQWLSFSCFQKYHVDHIVPLQGDNVSGLHVPWNLQVIPAQENLRKNKHFKG
jgi:hypothetical protein